MNERILETSKLIVSNSIWNRNTARMRCGGIIDLKSTQKNKTTVNLCCGIYKDE
jgi:hypothetical protein